MSAAHKEPNYMAIFWWLLALTILEIGATRLPVPHMIIAILLVGMALSKAALVAMYFMHLKFERHTLAIIAVTPLFLCIFLSLMLLPDSGSKDRIKPPPAAARSGGGRGSQPPGG
jgi:cytochrome c oxidase subunit 4